MITIQNNILEETSLKKALALTLAMILALSLAACGGTSGNSTAPSGNNSTPTPKPPSDSAVIKEVEKEAEKIESGPSQKILEDGRYEIENENYTGPLKWLTFGTGGAYEDSFSGTGKYTIKGSKLTINFDNGAFTTYEIKTSDGGKTLTLDDGNSYIWAEPVEEPALPYEPYTPSADDPYPGLIIGTVASKESPRLPERLAVNIDELEKYVRGNLQSNLDRAPGDARLFQPLLDGQFFIDGDVLPDGTAVWYDRNRVYITFTAEYGYVAIFETLTSQVSFDIGERRPATPYHLEDGIKYSVSLGRVLTKDEGYAKKIDLDEAFKLWHDDYVEFVEKK
jgi:hypothetical protein